MSTVRTIMLSMAWVALIGFLGLYIVDVAERKWVLASAVWFFGLGALIPAKRAAPHAEMETIPRGN